MIKSLVLAGLLISPGYDLIEIQAYDGNTLNMYTYTAPGYGEDSPIWFVVHGQNRNADDYRDDAAEHAERYGALALAIEFPDTLYSNFTLNEDLYRTIEKVFDEVKQNQTGYYIFGHSAGSQFVHRMETFLPDNRIISSVAANAGWYTLPNDNFEYPYGTTRDTSHLCNNSINILVGEYDTQHHSESSSIRSTEEAVAQGENRYERSFYYYNAMLENCEGSCHNIRHEVVPEVGHSKRGMLPRSADVLFWNE